MLTDLKTIWVATTISQMQAIVLKLLFDTFSNNSKRLNGVQKIMFLHPRESVDRSCVLPFRIPSPRCSVEFCETVLNHMVVKHRHSSHPGKDNRCTIQRWF